jgi:PKD-like domain
MLTGALLMLLAQGGFGGEAAAQVLDKQCPTLTVSCPTGEIRVGDRFTVNAKVSGAEAETVLSYVWSISAGKIMSGQGTDSITVDTSAMAGQSPTMTVEVGGIKGCPLMESCSIIFEALRFIEPSKFDEYSELSFREEKQRLDNLAAQLREEPGAVAYIIVYAGRRTRPGEVRARVKRARRYLIKQRGVEAKQVVFADGGTRERLTFEIQLMPMFLRLEIYPIIPPETEPAARKARSKRRSP